MTNISEMTTETSSLFEKIVKDLPNWSGVTPCFNHITKELRGNLTDLKKQNLVTTFTSNGDQWIELTESGKEYAKSLGLL